MLSWALAGCRVAWDRVYPIAPWYHLIRHVETMPMGLEDAVDFVSTVAGWMVAAAWFTLVVAGASRPEPSWIDRAGRILGACWIAVVIVNSFLLS